MTRRDALQRDARSGYVLGYSDAEHERLIRQAERLAGCSERFFRAAGIGEAQRVLEFGSGVGDVAMLVARLVGPAGSVVGVERDARSIERARARVAAAGLSNVTFTQSDVAEIASDQLFDAVVGRFILMFVPDPVAVLRSALRKLRPGGVVAFHEPSWIPTLQLSAHLPLRSACLSLAHDAIRRSGAQTEMGLALQRVFPAAGLPPPNMLVEVPVGMDRASTRWTHDLFCTVLPQLPAGDPGLATLGDLASLAERLDAEVAASNGVVPFLGMVGAWSRKP